MQNINLYNIPTLDGFAKLKESNHLPDLIVSNTYNFFVNKNNNAQLLWNTIYKTLPKSTIIMLQVNKKFIENVIVENYHHLKDILHTTNPDEKFLIFSNLNLSKISNKLMKQFFFNCFSEIF